MRTTLQVRGHQLLLKICICSRSGNGRLSGIDDMMELPYIRDVIKEILRCIPTTVSAALWHRVTANDTIEGYDLPAGTSILLAVWIINHDTDLFPDPRNLEPNRHSVSVKARDAAQASDIRDRDHWTFGVGRRICSRLHLTENTLLLGFTRILWALLSARSGMSRGMRLKATQLPSRTRLLCVSCLLGK